MRWWLLLVLGCDADPPAEGGEAGSSAAVASAGHGESSDPFLRAIQGGGLSVDERLELCSQVADADMAADCSAMVVKSIPGGPEQACPRIPEGRWQDECWFEAAEMRLDQGSMEEL